MLSHKILTRQDVGRAASYYEDSADDYYAKDGSSSGWQGLGAKTLKLKGAVDSESFRKLLAGDISYLESSMQEKSTETSLSQTNPVNSNVRHKTRHDSNNRIGIDFTFSAPKSLSMQALIALDSNIITAHDKAVKRTLEITEKKAEARKKINGKSYVEKTKNLIIAKFRHETSRERDPQLHTHAIIMNLTQREDGRWCALRNDEIIKMTKYLGAVYRSELAASLQKMGYSLRDEGKGFFELAHITKQQIDGFSKRSDQIEELLAKQGLNRTTATQSQKQRATMLSRSPKVATERSEILKEWQQTAKELGINFDHSTYNKQSHIQQNGLDKSVKLEITKVAKLEAAKRAVRFAINHLSEREAVIKEREILDIATKQSIGATTLPAIKRELQHHIKSGHLIKEDELYKPTADAAKETSQVKSKEGWIDEIAHKGKTKTEARSYINKAIKQGRLIKLEPRYTTESAIRKEKHILQIEHRGRNSQIPIMPIEVATKQLKPSNLNQGQKEAALLILTTTNRIVGIQGYAGTGKSHMLKATKQMIEQSGYNIKALAPYGSQVKALKTLGIEARTLASFLKAKNKNLDSRTIIIIDEAGVIPTRQMEQALKLIEKNNARAGLLGDIAQTKAIEAGKPFEQLQKAGMSTAYMEQIERQKQPKLKEAVELAAKGQTTSSLELISKITEIKNEERRLQRIVNDYTALSPSDRDKTIIVSGTNVARRFINNAVREKLKSNGELETKETTLDTLTTRDATAAERKYSKYYHLHDIIIPEKDYPKIGLKQNALYEVTGKGEGSQNKLIVKAKESGKIIEFSPMIYNKIRPYEHQCTELAIGDIVRITQNYSKLGLVNGDRLKVNEIQIPEQHKGKRNGERVGEQESRYIMLESPDKSGSFKLPTNKPLHLDYAYATTVHSSQGLTSDLSLIDIKTKSLTASQDAYYVAISRARTEVRIYTDNIKELPRAVSRMREKGVAIEVEKTSSYRHTCSVKVKT